jgi:hypothetical protein
VDVDTEVFAVRLVSQILRIAISLTHLHLSVHPHEASPPRLKILNGPFKNVLRGMYFVELIIQVPSSPQL